MSLTPADLLTRVRYKIVDPDSNDFTDTELMLFLNEAGRILHGMITDRRPMTLATTKSATLSALAASITLDYNPRRILDVRVNGYVLPVIDPLGIFDPTQTGIPGWYYLSGFKAVTFFPTPAGSDTYAAVVRYVPEYTEMAAEGGSCVYPDQALDLLVEFAAIRAGMRNEADVSQETALLRNWRTEVQGWLGDLTPPHETDRVAPYWE